MYVCTIKKAFITFYYTTILLVTPAENIFGEFSCQTFRASFITKLNPVAVYLSVFLNGAWLESVCWWEVPDPGYQQCALLPTQHWRGSQL
jgi:hypothetical protein